MQTVILKTVAVVLILYSAFARQSRKPVETAALLSVISGVLLLYWTKSGPGGIVFSASGILAAAAGTGACHIIRRVTPEEYFTAVALGAITGPAGIIMIIMIVFMMNLIQKISGNPCVAAKERIIRHFLESDGAVPCIDGYLGVSISEADRLLRPGSIYPEEEGAEEAENSESTSAQKIFPWGIKLALATLAILTSGIYI